MSINGGDIIGEFLAGQGVSSLFTLCGGHISPILTGCKKQGIRIIDTRSEASAVFAADAMSRITGIPGVAAVTAGPGVTNTVTAVKNAQMAQSPLILLGGAAATIIKGRGSLQDINQVSLLRTIVKAALTIRRNCDIIPRLEQAFRIAVSGVPGPVFVECPVDLLYDEALVREWYGRESGTIKGRGIRERIIRLYIRRHIDRMYECDFNAMEPGHIITDKTASAAGPVSRAAKKLSAARRPLLIMGSQALLNSRESGRLAGAVDRIGVPVYLTGMARGLLGADNPLHLRHSRREALMDADLLILAGIPFDFRLGYGNQVNPGSYVISVNRSRRDLHLNRRPDMGIHDDPFAFICGLAGSLSTHNNMDTEWIQFLRKRETERDNDIVSKSLRKTEYINPLLLLKKLDAFLEEKSVIAADGGDFVASASYIVRPRKPLSWLDPGVFGTLGVGAGFAMGVKAARPESEAWILYGDGAAGYSLQEFDTMLRHGLPAIALIGNDAGWTQIARDQAEILKDDVGTSLRYSDYHIVAKGYGCEGFVISREEEIDEVFQQARETAYRGKPVVINALIGKTDFRKGSVSM